MVLVATSPASMLHGMSCSQTETVGPQDSGIPDHPPSPAHLRPDKWASDKEMELSSKQALPRQTPRGQHSSSTSEVLLATLKIQGER